MSRIRLATESNCWSPTGREGEPIRDFTEPIQRLIRPMSMRVATALTAIIVLAACGGGDPMSGDSSSSSPPEVGQPSPENDRVTPDITRPPAVIVRGGAELSLDAFTACFGNGCFDGPPTEPLPDIGAADSIDVDFPIEGWQFSAEFVEADVECGRRMITQLEQMGPTMHQLDPIGPAGTYDITLFGRAMNSDVGGDLFVAFRWTTDVAGARPVPSAMASILADHDGDVDSYGIEIPITGMAATPESASGEVTVTSSEGNSHTFAIETSDTFCSEGDLFFTAPDGEGKTAAGLGTSPFTYRIELNLDGVAHIGTAVWPNGEQPECAPCTTVTFQPPLPSLDQTDSS